MKKYNVVIVGGGSHRNPDLMAMLASKKDVFPLKRVVLYDNEAERQEIMGQYGEILMREYYPELEEFIYTTDPDVASGECLRICLTNSIIEGTLRNP